MRVASRRSANSAAWQKDLTTKNIALGTISYMSPEQVAGKPLDGPSKKTPTERPMGPSFTNTRNRPASGTRSYLHSLKRSS